MNGLVRCIDYQVVDDPDPEFVLWIENALKIVDKPSHLHFLDVIIDDAVRCDGLLGGLEPICEIIEDYCLKCGLDMTLPCYELYNYIFRGRGGFLTQSKSINYLQDEWQMIVPDPMTQCIPYDEDFMDFLSQNVKQPHAVFITWYKEATQTECDARSVAQN